MLSKYILPGEKVELQMIRRNSKKTDDEGHKVYQSRVFDIVSDDQVEITMPMEKTKIILLPVDAEYDMYFYTKSGLFQCFAKIVNRYKSNNVYILGLELISNLRKFQRRDFYRYSCSLDMDIRTLEEEEISAIENKKQYLKPGLPLQKAVIVDISGGGIRFVAKKMYDAGSLINCKYELIVNGKVKEYNLVGKVLSSQQIENRQGEYEHRVQYINITEGEREEIIRYIFEEERKHRKIEKR